MSGLYDKLKNNANSDMYPYHMPGHKRRLYGHMPKEFFELDITEIDGFDNLHQPQEIIFEIEDKLSKLYGSDNSYMLVNGSTSGILAAISAALSCGEKILISRNCHKSVYHSIYLRHLKVDYIYPQMCGDFDFYEGTSLASVQEALEKNPDTKAVLIVSPTYEGRIAEVRKIAEYLHERNIILIVDEAHGAHLIPGMANDYLAQNSCVCGADLVINSLHKTLPSFTQTAVIHRNGNLISDEKLRRFLRIYQSSSPSYLLMASVENALKILEENGQELYNNMCSSFYALNKKLEDCTHLRFIKLSNKQDIGKLVISTKGTNISGQELYDLLRDKYHLQLELAAATYCLAMFTIGDTEEGYDRMANALLEIDKDLKDADYEDISTNIKAEKVLELSSAWDMDTEVLTLEKACDKLAGEFVNVYPPGTPILVPGEKITKEAVALIQDCIDKKLNLQGIRENDNILVIKEQAQH